MIIGALVVTIAGIITIVSGFINGDQNTGSEHVVTIYDDGKEKTVVTRSQIVSDALKDAEISIGEYDAISPSVNSQMKNASQIVVIHRARPVVVVDGRREVKIVTADQSVTDIARAAGVAIYAEDTASTGVADDILSAGGASVTMQIARAKTVNLELYGQSMAIRTRAQTVGEFLKEKDIQMASSDGINVRQTDTVTDQMTIRIWRDGIQTITTTEKINYITNVIKDQTLKYGYRETRAAGRDGQKTVIYQIEVKDGQEISRTIISQVVNVAPIDQVEIVGMKSDLNVPALSASRGAQVYRVGSITRKETYYDLPMSGAMQACGQKGYYEVRSDGVKVDRDGYVIVAANLSRYPRCSEVDTSVGRGKVYDTGGFAVNSPEQFDIATDWSNRNGR